ncbi:MAG: hypothetical protein WC976_06510 [Caldisericia bacterium]
MPMTHDENQCLGYLELQDDITLKCDVCGKTVKASERVDEIINDDVDGYHMGELEILQAKQEAIIKILELVLKNMGK